MIKIDKEIVEIIENDNAVKVLSTVDQEGNPYVVFKQSLFLTEKGYLGFYELLESSVTNKNMTHSIWFQKKVSVNVRLGEKSYQIRGIPYRALIHGQEFERHYRTVIENKRAQDLSTVWMIEPIEIREETFRIREKIEREENPILSHLDRLV